jgi:hypothetical protein
MGNFGEGLAQPGNRLIANKQARESATILIARFFIRLSSNLAKF